MIRWLVGSSIQFRLLVVAATAVILFYGFTQLGSTPVDVLPEFSRPYVEVQTEALGLSAAEVEALITTPLEADMLNGVSWMDEIRSQSIPGLSSIVMFFEPGTNMLAARQMVQERLVAVHALPNVSKPPAMLNPTSSASRCMAIGLSSEDLSLIDMSVLARWSIKPRLMGVPGVAHVSIWGQRKRQLQVQVDPAELRDKGVTLSQVINTTGNSLWVTPLSFLNASTPGTGGFIDTPNQRLGVQHVLPISTPEQLAEVTVEGTNLQLRDVAQVVEDHQPLIGDAVVEDSPALMLVVEKFPWANTREVTHGVEEALGALQHGLAGMQVDSTLFRPATFVDTVIRNLSTSLLVGAGLLVVVLLALLYNWRSAVTATLGILTSVIAAAVVLHVFGIEINTLILVGLLIGLCLVIDDVIVDTQNIVRRLHQRRRDQGSDESLAWVIREAAVEMRGVVAYAFVIALLAIAPALFMQGLTGALLQPLAIAFGLAVVASMVVALSLTPVLSVLFWRNAQLDGGESAFARLVKSSFDSVCAPHLNKTAPAFGIAAVLVAAAVLAFPRVRQESLVPTFKETELLVELDAESGTSHPAMSRIVAQATNELRSISGVNNVSAHLGRAVMSDEIADVNSGKIWVTVDPSADYEQTLAAVEAVAAGYPGLEREVSTFHNEKLTDELRGEEAGIVVRVYGDDLRVLRGKASEVRNLLARVPGVVNPVADFPRDEPTLEIEVDLDKAKSHGIKPGDVRRSATALLSGIECGALFEHQKVFDVVVWGKPETRRNLTDIQELLIDTPRGDQVQLHEVADIRIAPAATNIQREAVARYIDVVGQLQGRDLASVASDIQRGLQQVDFPLEYRAELLGAPAERLAAQQHTRNFAIAAAFGIFLVLQAACGSWRLASLLFVMLPLAMVGGLLATFAAGGLMSIGSVAGFVVLLGISARNGILLVRRYQQLAANPDIDEIDPEVEHFRAQFEQGSLVGGPQDAEGKINPLVVLRGTRDRLAPILASALAIGAVFAPIAVFGNIAGQELVYPMAIVVLGGLVTSTLVSLFVLPSMYLWLRAEPAEDIVTEPITEVAASESSPAAAATEEAAVPAT